MIKTLWLIAEDETDRQVFQRLFDARGITVRVEFLKPTGNSGGVSRLAHQLEKLIETAKARRRADDCIIVFHDDDVYIQPDRTHYDRIAAICQQYQADVALLIARDEIESWLLADEGLCRWLDIKPQNCDSQKQPSDKLNHVLQQKRKMKYQGPDRAKVLGQINGTGDKHSPSMKQAFQTLQQHCGTG